MLLFIRNALLSAALLSLVSSALGCSVPVFRYALERWVADPFGAAVFHRGVLSAEHAAMVDKLSSSSANLSVTTVDLDSSSIDATALETWEEQESETMPWLYATYPNSHPVAVELAAGDLHLGLIDKILTSPMRQQIATQLVEGETAVWVLLESGDEAKDQAAWKLLNDTLAELETVLELPTIEQEDIDAGLLSVSEDELKISFSGLRLSRDDAPEEMFVRMLLDTEEDLIDSEEPIVFPIFGRGRVLYGLVGAGITEETIEHSAAYLVGACSCQVKEENPGVDLLMAVAWDEVVQTSFQEDKPLPELSGLLPSVTSDEELKLDAPVVKEAAPTPPAEVAPAAKNDTRLILWTTLPVLVLMLLVVVFGSAVFRAKSV